MNNDVTSLKNSAFGNPTPRKKFFLFSFRDSERYGASSMDMVEITNG